MNPPEQRIEDSENVIIKNDIKLGKNGDATIVNDVMVEESEKKEREPRQEKEMIEKAIAFWNHPALRDVPFTEKRSYLHEQQGLTNAQIHKVWEEMVGTSRVEVYNNINNRPDSNITGEDNATVSQQHYRHSHPHHRYDNYRSSTHPPTSTTAGQNFHSNEAPHSQSSASNYNMMNSGQHPFPPMSNDNSLMMEGADGSISVARGLSLLGVGGLLGVTGAASLRWLNGGRFELFPPPPSIARMNTLSSTGISRRKSVTDKQQIQGQASFLQPETHQHGQGNNEVEEDANERTKRNIDRENRNLNNESEYDEEGEYGGVEYSDNNEDFDMEECLLERIDALLSSIDSNSTLQEKLILKLANTSTITDDSMSLLKQNIDSNIHSGKKNSDNKISNTTGITGSNSKLLAQLKEVKNGLANLCESMTNDLSPKSGHINGIQEDWRKEYSALLSRFDNCIQTLENPIDSFVVDSDAADSKSISTSETAQTENEGQQDIQALPAAQSTPSADTSNKNQMSATTTSLIPLSLKDCILKIVEKNNTVSLKNGSQLLYLYLANLSGQPDNRRYRKIFTSNESFQKVEKLIGGKDLLQAVGFVEESDKSVLEWVPTGSTEKEISALILVKEAAAALGLLKKPDNVPSSELVQLALSKLSLSSSSFPAPKQSPLPSHQLDGNDNDNESEDFPQTPSGSSLQSPPIPKKIPFAPTPSIIS